MPISPQACLRGQFLCFHSLTKEHNKCVVALASPNRFVVALANPNRCEVGLASPYKPVVALASPYKPVGVSASPYRLVVALASPHRAPILLQECVLRMRLFTSSVPSPHGHGHPSLGRERPSQQRRSGRGCERNQAASLSMTSEMAADTSLQEGWTTSRGHQPETKASGDPERPGMGRVPPLGGEAAGVEGVPPARLGSLLGRRWNPSAASTSPGALGPRTEQPPPPHGREKSQDGTPEQANQVKVKGKQAKASHLSEKGAMAVPGLTQSPRRSKTRTVETAPSQTRGGGKVRTG